MAKETATELFDAIRAGDEKAFEHAFHSYYQPLCFHAIKYVKALPAAEELVQEVFFKLWEKREQLQVTSSLQAYLYKAVGNACLNQLKFQKVRSDYQAANSNQLHASSADSTERPERELAIAIDQAINQLPTERQRIFRMSRFEELKYAEIADQLNISVKTVEAQMGKALKFLREQLTEFMTIAVILITEAIKNSWGG